MENVYCALAMLGFFAVVLVGSTIAVYAGLIGGYARLYGAREAFACLRELAATWRRGPLPGATAPDRWV